VDSGTDLEADLGVVEAVEAVEVVSAEDAMRVVAAVLGVDVVAAIEVDVVAAIEVDGWRKGWSRRSRWF